MSKFWLNHPWVYDFIQFAATGGFWKPVSKELSELNGRRVLDLGCGTGALLEWVKPQKYVGLDNNSAFIKFAKKKYPGQRFLVKDITKDAFPQDKFDFVVIVNVLHHLSDGELEKLFPKIKRWGKGAKLVIVESKPRGPLGSIFKRFDVGANFHQFTALKKLVKKAHRVQSDKVVRAPWGTYDYLILKAEI